MLDLRRLGLAQIFLVPTLTLVIGMAAGVAIGYNLAPRDSVARSAKAYQTIKEIASDGGQDLLDADSLNAANQLVDRDQRAGRIGKEQADVLKQKLKEAHEYLQKALASGDEKVIRQINAKKLEWRDWARRHDVSNRYFLRLY